MPPIALTLVLAASLPAAGAAPGATEVRDAVRSWREAHAQQVLQEFVQLLALPNRGTDAAEIRKNADRIVRMLEARGFATRLLETEGSPPAVYGELSVPGAARTLALYAHYDGQPVEPSRWAGDPFAPVLRDGPLESGGREVPLSAVGAEGSGEWRLYARSAGDDKAPIVGILAALDALRSRAIPLGVNVKLLFEGEEELGSPHLGAILRRNASLLGADLWLLCDGPVHQSRRMQLFFGARGIVDVELTVHGPTRALHSGHYGNWAPNPAVLLVQLLSGMRDADGRITIEGFSDRVRPPTESERRALAEVPDADAGLRRELGLAATEAGNARLVERLMLPALNLRGLDAGQVAEAAANAIPTQARASIDFRLVPDQTPEQVRRAVEGHLSRRGWLVLHAPPTLGERLRHPRIVELHWGSGYPAARTDMDLPACREVVGIVREAAGGQLVVLPTLGGSIPLYLFRDILHAPVVGLPIANHDDNQHAANENLRLQNLWDGIEVYAALLSRLAQ